MICQLGAKIFNVRYIDNAGNESPAMAVKSNAHHTVAGSSVTAANVDLCAATKLPGPRFCFNATFTKRMFAFDVCNNTPSTLLWVPWIIGHFSNLLDC